MSTSDVFKQFYIKLIKTLPMDDSLFVAELFACGLLPGDLKHQIEAKKTLIDKATCFLDNKISRDISIDNSTSLNKLLTVMEQSDSDSLKDLAKQIRISLEGETMNSPSMPTG